MGWYYRRAGVRRLDSARRDIKFSTPQLSDKLPSLHYVDKQVCRYGTVKARLSQPDPMFGRFAACCLSEDSLNSNTADYEQDGDCP